MQDRNHNNISENRWGISTWVSVNRTFLKRAGSHTFKIKLLIQEGSCFHGAIPSWTISQITLFVRWKSRWSAAIRPASHPRIIVGSSPSLRLIVNAIAGKVSLALQQPGLPNVGFQTLPIPLRSPLTIGDGSLTQAEGNSRDQVDSDWRIREANSGGVSLTHPCTIG